MIDSIKQYIRQNLPLFGTIGGIGGFVNDVLSPLANLSLYLLIASLVGVGITSIFYLYFRRDNVVTKQEAAKTRVVFFGVFAIIWAIFALVHVAGPKNGVLAATVPGVEDLQRSIGILQEDVNEIKRTTADIKGDTAQILLQLGELKADLQAAEQGSITTRPDTAEEWYGNAVLYASQGKNDEAVAAYREFFAYGYPYIDAYQNFNLIAKYEMSKNELATLYRELADDQPANVVAALMEGALMKDTAQRRAHYDTVRTLYGDSSVLLYWLMNEYSVVGTYVYANELSASEQQKWTTSDQAKLKEVVTALTSLPPTDNLEVYFINTFMYDGVRTLINTYKNQFADSTVSAMLDNPIVLVVNPAGPENESMLTFVIYDSYTDIRYRVLGVVDEFTSTIPDTATRNSPWGSAQASPETSVTIPMNPGTYTVEVSWLNMNGDPSPVYVFENTQFTDFATWSAGDTSPVWLYPTSTR
ncbi:hypothetical protein KBC55_01430 [Patescibacteria group bacterium]|nr:hypothetical protein [Patescibacteria group bacterium]